jgi:nitrous oxidase accessory protein
MAMKKSVLTVLLVAIVLCGLALAGVHQIKAVSKTIIVPDDYPTIQTAIGNATTGDTVFVESGTYNGTVVIDKPLSLIGHDSKDTFIIGSRPVGTYNPSAIEVQSDNVSISGFTVKNTWHGIRVNTFSSKGPNGIRITENNILNNYVFGIVVSYCSNVLISNNNISGNGETGLEIDNSNYTQIIENNVTENGASTSQFGSNIQIYGFNVTVKNNTISNSSIGLSISGTNIEAYQNRITLSQDYGLWLRPCNNSQIHDNVIANNSIGIDLQNYLLKYWSGTNNVVYRNNLISNFYLSYTLPSGNYSAPSQNAVVEATYPYGNPDNITGYSPSGTDIVVWDNGQVGNYWSDYSSKYPNAIEVDSTGIGNTPFVIDSNNIDHYPLMSAFNITLASPSPTLTPSSSVPEFPSLIILPSALAIVTVLTAIVSIRRKKLNQLR